MLNYLSLRGVVAAFLLISSHSYAETATIDPVVAEIAKASGGQQRMKLPIRVIDPDGNPVSNAKVTPWALRSSQGHGQWKKDDVRSKLDPMEVATKSDGTAIVIYPLLRHVTEQIHTTSVSVSVDHPSFAYVESVHIDVPLETNRPHVIQLQKGVDLEVRPLVDGKPTTLENLYVLWSDGRSWLPGVVPEYTADATLRIPTMPPGENSLLLVRLDGDQATHFSKITYFELTADKPATIDVPLAPSQRVEGKLSSNVPRPVKNGRVKIHSLPTNHFRSEQITWSTWAPIRPDGAFTIDAWPAGEPLQLVALCDGYIAESGKLPAIKNYEVKPTGNYYRPHVFETTSGAEIEVPMTAVARCVVTTLDQDEKPVAGVKVDSAPNVGWWNWGSQIYAEPLTRGELLLRERDYAASIEKPFPRPFTATTDAQGEATLQLPAGNEDLYIDSEVYDLPAFLGRRRVDVKNLKSGETTRVTLRLEPKGTEKLGEWDKLAGVVFGCSTREGRRICALPEVSKKMDEFATRFREGKNRRDPKLLAEAYTLVAEAFVGVGDQQEAEKWRTKAAEQASKIPAAQN